MKNVIGFNGSPRALGNTSRLVKAILGGAEAAGAKTRYIHLASLTFGDCSACMNCRQQPACVLGDDMAKLIGDILRADAIVLGSPVYMWQVTGLTKLFMDRLYPVLNPDFSSRLTRRPKLALAFTQGHPDTSSFKAYFEQTRKVFSLLGFQPVDMVVAGGTRNSDDIDRQTDLLARAREVGALLL